MAEHKVAKTSDISAGQGKSFNINDQEIAVFNQDGQFFAIDNTCKHRGGSLVEGTLEGDTITCPLHGWQYKITSGECLMNPQVTLQTFAVKVENDEVCLEL